MIRVRAFRAIDDKEACNLYAREHMEVLKIFGITKITTANNSWIFNPNVYVVLAERIEDNVPIGGARIHLYDKDFPLPMDDAIKEFDPSVKELLEKHAINGTGEICGLWNARSVAGWGIGTLFLARAGVALAAQLPMKSLFVLCGSHTIGITLEKGFVVEEQLGNKGTFYYPKEGLVATAAVINDIYDLSHAAEHDRVIINSLRSNPSQVRQESTEKLTFEINYELNLKKSI
ncbi:MAG: hypothetical protein K9G49_09945 [Taibaiella sp.]|nr:hypothetical protein [Taibaiella sp.]